MSLDTKEYKFPNIKIMKKNNYKMQRIHECQDYINLCNVIGNIAQICFNKSIKLISEEGTTNQKRFSNNYAIITIKIYSVHNN